jgi:hypothetical protein
MFENAQFKKLTLAGTIGSLMLISNIANAHVTYNTTGNGDAATGSPVDGSQAGPWSNGNPGYTGNLPATWVAEIHNAGGATNTQTASSAGAGFDIGMGARAYKDGTTNWGMTSDFGLFHLQEAATVTITVASDGSDLRPAFGLWNGWDEGGGSRHAAYTSNGAIGPMAAGILDSTLTLVDGNAWAFASSQGTTASAQLTRFLAAGDYTLILGGYDGATAGANLKYTASISAAPVPLPAAVWMFGAALMGWLGIQKRKMAA